MLSLSFAVEFNETAFLPVVNLDFIAQAGSFGALACPEIELMFSLGSAKFAPIHSLSLPLPLLSHPLKP
jgi:hypothetical protein